MKCGVSPLSSPVVTCTGDQTGTCSSQGSFCTKNSRKRGTCQWGGERRDLVVKPARGHFSALPQGNSAGWDTVGLDTFLVDSPGATNVILVAFTIVSCPHPIAAQHIKPELLQQSRTARALSKSSLSPVKTQTSVPHALLMLLQVAAGAFWVWYQS